MYPRCQVAVWYFLKPLFGLRQPDEVAAASWNITIWRPETGAVFEAKFMLPWSFAEEGAIEKHMTQLQHNMLVAGTKKSVLSIINGGGKWIELSIEADPIYQTILIAAEKAFWRAVKTGEPPALFDCEPPKPRIEAVRVVDMNASNSWAEFAG